MSVSEAAKVLPTAMDEKTARVLIVSSDRSRVEQYRRSIEPQFAIDLAVGPSIAIGQLQNASKHFGLLYELQDDEEKTKKFLARVREVSPLTVRVLLCSEPQFGQAIRLTNDLDLFGCLPIPCEAPALRKLLTRSYAHHNLATEHQAILRETLGGAVKVLIDVLALVSPTVFSRTSRVTHYVQELAKALGLHQEWQASLASMLYRIGCITLPAETLDNYFSGRVRNGDDQRLIDALPQVTAAMLANIPRIDAIIHIIEGTERLYQHTSRTELIGTLEQERLASFILRAASDFDHHLVCGLSTADALKSMKGSGKYHPEVLKALEKIRPAEQRWTTRIMRVQQLAPGMILAEDVTTLQGMLLMSKGDMVTYAVVEKLNSVAKSSSGITQPFRVLVPTSIEEEDADRFS